MKIAKKDPGDNHFAISLVKSIFRFVASGLLIYAGYVLWSANMYSDIFIELTFSVKTCFQILYKNVPKTDEN